MYAQIEVLEITKLATLKASGLCTQVYMILAAHDWGRGSCFPSLKTISNKLGCAYHIKSITRALKWLEDNLLIKRREATSKERFVLLLRKVKDVVTKSFQPEQNRYHKKQMNRRKNIHSSKQARSRSQNKLTKSQKMENQIYDWLDNVGSLKSDIEYHANPSNKPFVERFNLTPPTATLPTTRPENFSNEAVYKVIKDRGWGLPENSWIWKFWQNLKSENGGSQKQTHGL